MAHASGHSHASCGDAACATCEPQTPLRNNYFFGKLMDVADFDVEQQYLVDKFRRHHQRLHGTGVVCGLEVGAHANPACRERFLVVEPGSALDCCGNEIQVLHQEHVDVLAFPAVAALVADEEDDDDHVLQLCIRYRECPTEEIPVLYDDCACDDTRCAPNRVLESYVFDIRVDPELPAPVAPHAPALTWQSTISLDDARAVVSHVASDRLYVAAALSPSGGIVQQYRLGTQVPVAPATFATAVLALAVSADGTRLHVVTSGATAADPAQLHVLDTTSAAAFSGAALGTVDLPDSATSERAELVLLASGDLFSFVRAAGQSTLQVWDLGTSPPTARAGLTAQLNDKFMGLALESDGTSVLAALVEDGWIRFDTTIAGLAPDAIVVSATDVVGVAIVRSTAPDIVAWIEFSGRKLRLAKIDGTAIAETTLPEKPIALSVDADGRYAYVLQWTGGDAVLQPVDLHRVIAGEPQALGAAIPIGGDASALALGPMLYVAYGDGVAVVAIESSRCGDLIGPHGCPSCETADCLVLATLQGWRPGRRFEDALQPPSDPLADAAAGIVRIDERLGRLIVPSVTDLARALECVIATGGGGGVGTQGPPGLPGSNGADGADGEDGEDGKDGEDGAVGPIGPIGPVGPIGPAGPAGTGLDPDFVHICSINWKHAGTNESMAVIGKGLVIGFDGPVQSSDLHRMSIELEVLHIDDLYQCWCQPRSLDIIPGKLDPPCSPDGQFHAAPGALEATAVMVRLKQTDLVGRGNGLVRIRLKGDFIRGIHHVTGKLRAVDADHLPPWLPSAKSGDGVEGGTFESWFTVAG